MKNKNKLYKVAKSIPLTHKYMTPNTQIHDQSLSCLDTPNTQIHDQSLSWLGTGTSIKSDGATPHVLDK
jgi:hypothetical protein